MKISLYKEAGSYKTCSIKTINHKWVQEILLQNQWNFFSRHFLQINLDGVLPVTKYKSKLTGLTIVFAQAESPIVNGYFCLPTEAYDDDGLPHTLEHLIFLGR